MRAVHDTVIITEVKLTKSLKGILLTKPIIKFVVHDYGPSVTDILPEDEVILRHDTAVTGFLGADQKTQYGAIRASDIVAIIPGEDND